MGLANRCGRGEGAALIDANRYTQPPSSPHQLRAPVSRGGFYGGAFSDTVSGAGKPDSRSANWIGDAFSLHRENRAISHLPAWYMAILPLYWEGDGPCATANCRRSNPLCEPGRRWGVANGAWGWKGEEEGSWAAASAPFPSLLTGQPRQSRDSFSQAPLSRLMKGSPAFWCGVPLLTFAFGGSGSGGLLLRNAIRALARGWHIDSAFELGSFAERGREGAGDHPSSQPTCGHMCGTKRQVRASLQSPGMRPARHSLPHIALHLRFFAGTGLSSTGAGEGGGLCSD